jgi:hypothetical protein
MPSEREQAISERAYAIWEQEGHPEGKDIDHWRQAEFEHRYFHTLGIVVSEKPRLEAALTRAYRLRDFEIEHYWKRGTYFWTLQGAIFIALGVLWRERIEVNVVMVALSGLGVLTAVANALAALGSKFWQENWESHIDMLEDEVDGRLHKTVWLRNGMLRFSVSGINQLLSVCFIVFWIIVTLYIVSGLIDRPTSGIYVLIVGVIIAVGVGLLFRRTTSLDATLPDRDGRHGPQKIKAVFALFGRRVCAAKKPQDFVRRYAPDEFS